MAGIRVRALTEDDVSWAVALTDSEGWGYSAADLDRLRFLEPDGVFLVEKDGARVGITATTTYGPLAYLGAVIVSPNERGTGMGRTLMEAALAYLDGKGVESVRLNAYEHTVALYERFGFRSEFWSCRFEGTAGGGSAPGVRLVQEEDLSALASMDQTYFGAERTRLLARLMEEFPRTFLVLDDGGEAVAYAVGNPSAPTCEIGPVVCPPDRAAQAGELLHAMFAAVDGRCALTVPDPNVTGIKVAKGMGLQRTFRTMRMVRGTNEFGGDSRGVFGLAGLEKG